MSGPDPLGAHPASLTTPTFILDASAILRFLDHERGSDRVFQISRGKNLEQCQVVASSLHWGEVACVLNRRSSALDGKQILKELRILGIEIIAAIADRAVHAAEIQVRLKLPYVDSFGIELAHDSPAISSSRQTSISNQLPTKSRSSFFLSSDCTDENAVDRSLDASITHKSCACGASLVPDSA